MNTLPAVRTVTRPAGAYLMIKREMSVVDGSTAEHPVFRDGAWRKHERNMAKNRIDITVGNGMKFCLNVRKIYDLNPTSSLSNLYPIPYLFEGAAESGRVHHSSENPPHDLNNRARSLMAERAAYNRLVVVRFHPCLKLEADHD